MPDRSQTNRSTGCALVARFHHALADGTALARVLLELTDDEPDDDLAEAEREHRTGVPDPGPSYRLPSLTDMVGSATGAVNDVVRGGLHTMSRLQTMADPARLLVGNAEVEANRLGMADMEIAVRFRRKAGHHSAVMFPGSPIGCHNLANEV